jgi:predicted ABC-type ATPase
LGLVITLALIVILSGVLAVARVNDYLRKGRGFFVLEKEINTQEVS